MSLTLVRSAFLTLLWSEFGNTLNVATNYRSKKRKYHIVEKDEIGGLGVLSRFCVKFWPATTLYCLIPLRDGLMLFPNAEAITGARIRFLGIRANFKPTTSIQVNQTGC